jgi:hypothetical protein
MKNEAQVREQLLMAEKANKNAQLKELIIYCAALKWVLSE